MSTRLLLFLWLMAAGNLLFARTSPIDKADSLRFAYYNQMHQKYSVSHPDSAIFFLERGLKEFKNSKFDYGAAEASQMLGWLYINGGNLVKAKERFEGSLAIHEEAQNKDGIANALNGLGVIEGKRGNFKAAIEKFLRAIKYFEDTRNKKGIASTLLKLGVANEISNNLDRALSYYKQALIILEGSDGINVISLYNNIGSLYSRKREFKTAIPYFEKALKLTDSRPYGHIRMSTLTNLGNLYEELGENNKALTYYNRAKEITLKEHLPEEEARLIVDMASIIYPLDKESSAKMLDTALTLAREVGNKVLESEVLGALIAIYKDKNDYKKALQLQEQQFLIQDSIFNISREKEIQSLQANYDLEKAESRVAQLEVKNKKDILERDLVMLIAVTLALLLVVTVYYYRRTSGLLTRISKHEAELANANRVKDRLFSIIGHDLQGHIANIPMIIDQYRDGHTKEAEKTQLLNMLKDNAAIIMDTLRKLLYWGKLQIKGVSLRPVEFDAKQALQENMQLAKHAADSKQIILKDNIPPGTIIRADLDHFQFIIRNLLSNAVKYSNREGHITIEVDISDSLFATFMVSDKGIGMSAAKSRDIFEPFHSSTKGTADEGGSSLGLMLCKEFVEQNGGRIWCHSKEGQGTTFYFTLKKAGHPG